MLSRREILDELRRLGFTEFALLKNSVREFEKYMFENYGLEAEEAENTSSFRLDFEEIQGPALKDFKGPETQKE